MAAFEEIDVHNMTRQQAITAIAITRFLAPYFSSSMGPKINRYIMLFSR